MPPDSIAPIPDPGAPAPAAPLTFTCETLARELEVNETTIRRWSYSKLLPIPLKIGKAVRWSRREIEDWIAAGTPDREAWEAMKAAKKRREDWGRSA